MSISRLSATHAEAPEAPVIGEDFPIICETCLGPNPYCRMIKADMAKECRISGAPFTVFKWQGALRRWKETIVCSAVAREKNLCQSCLNDLEYAVPFHVRDSVMDALGEEIVPTSDVNSEFHWANKRQKMLDGEGGGHDTYEKLQTHVDKLKELAALNPGPVTWGQRRDTPLTPEEQEKLRQRRAAEKAPPADKSVTSLYCSGVPPSMSRAELLPYFMPYGEVAQLTMDEQRLAAVVTYRERSAAEAACKALHNNLTVKGRTRVRVSWARKKGASSGAGATVGGAGHDFYGHSALAVPPPKGGACAGRAASSSSTAAPPAARLPPGIKRNYPSQDPGALGTRPDRD